MRVFLFLFGLVFLVLAIFSAWFVPSAFIGSPTERTVSVTIPDQATISDIAQLLEQRGAIVSAFGYKLYSMIDQGAGQSRVGEYDVMIGSSYRAIARQLALGPKRNEMSIQFIEGSTLDDWQAEMNLQGVSATSVRDLIGDARIGTPFASALRDQYVFLSDLPEDASLEGYLFPNTYRVWKDQLPLGLALKQLNEFENQTEGFVEEAETQGRSLHEVVTLASIVEREGRTPEERRMIAGIFMNRLKVGMRLQSDATVNYVTKAGRARPTSKDLEADSPYNTYRNDGLPPGPICNPGKDALDAALHPTESQYYFYLHDDEGNIYYARNIEEHKVNRWKAYGE